VENRPPENVRRKSSKTPRRSRSNPQIRTRHLAELAIDTGPAKMPHSPDQRRSPGTDHALGREYNFRQFRAGNPCAVATPLSQQPPESRRFASYFVPLSDQPSSYWTQGNPGMIKSKSLDKLDEIMRNDPILGEDYLGASAAASKSTQTQTDAVQRKKKPRRKRNDRPRSQILPPTYLQLPSVTWLPNELGTSNNLQGAAAAHETTEVPNDCCLNPNYSRATSRRRSKEEQEQIVQRWINELIANKKAQGMRRQDVFRHSVGRERSAKLKKKSRSVPEHTFRGNVPKARRASDDSEEMNGEMNWKLRHSGSDPSFRFEISADERYMSVGTTTDEKISPSLQSRIRSLEQSFQQNNTSGSSLQSNNNPSEQPLGRNRSLSSPRLNRASNPDLPLISRLLSGGELDSQC
jgi:hypothetical protein